MMNDLIGVAGVAGATGLLFLIRHLVLTLGQHDSKRFGVPIPRLTDQGSNRVSDEDDAAWIWATEFDAQADAASAQDRSTEKTVPAEKGRRSHQR